MSYALLDTRTWHRTSATVMGCTAELMFDGPATLAPKAFDRLRELERSWSRFLPDSELNRLHERPGQWVHVSHELFTALHWCARLHDETEGRFDPSIRTALEAWGYDRTFRDIDQNSSSPTHTAPSPGLAGLELRRDDEAVRLAPGLRLDLGGVGKGLAADMLAGELLDHGRVRRVRERGRRHRGRRRRARRRVGRAAASTPITDVPFDTHRLTDGGLVMSTTQMRRWQRGDGVTAHHLIDPGTGRARRHRCHRGRGGGDERRPRRSTGEGGRRGRPRRRRRAARGLRGRRVDPHPRPR